MASFLRAQLPIALLLLSTSQLQLSSAYKLQVPVIGSSHAGSRGAVASESKICSQIGIDLIARGGNAADAMVGTNLCVGVIGMYHSGIGGGGFMLVRGPDGEYEVIDYRETAPAAAYENMFDGNVIGSVFGGLAVGVPSELRGLEYLHSKYGSLPWRSVVMPAVQVARNGFPVTEDLVRYMKAATKAPAPSNFLVEDPSWSQEFAPNGTLVGLGDILKRERLASTLEKIAHHGANIFYEGEIAKSMIDIIQANNGTMTLEDLKNYKVSTPRPVSVNFRGYKLWSTPSPTSGAVCLSIMKTLEQYPSDELSLAPQNINLTTHRIDEALRFGYGGRTSLGDPAFVPHIHELESRLLSEKSAAARRARILDDKTQPVDAYDPETEDGSDGKHSYANPGHGTSHIVTADGSGMTITSTTTINLLFGSLLITPDTGIILNNEMNDFSIPGVRNEFGFEPSVPNYIRPGKRPLSSITPLIAERAADGSLALSVGAAGGSRILSATCQVAWRVLEQGMGVVEAVAEPRVHDQLMPNESWFEWAFDNATVAGMAARGHNISWVPPIYSAVQAVQVLGDGTLVAARETRQKNSGGLGI